MRDQTDSRTLPLSLGKPRRQRPQQSGAAFLPPRAIDGKCPCCGELVSYDGNNEAYCAYDGCLWNNDVLPSGDNDSHTLTGLEKQTDAALVEGLQALVRARRIARHYCGDQFEGALDEAVNAVEFALATLHGTSVESERARLLSAFELPFEEAARGHVA